MAGPRHSCGIFHTRSTPGTFWNKLAVALPQSQPSLIPFLGIRLSCPAEVAAGVGGGAGQATSFSQPGDFGSAVGVMTLPGSTSPAKICGAKNTKLQKEGLSALESCSHRRLRPELSPHLAAGPSGSGAGRSRLPRAAAASPPCWALRDSSPP